MITKDDNHMLFESFARANVNIESMLKVAGLCELATAWIMFAYVTPELDSISLDKVTLKLKSELENKCKVDPAFSSKITRIAIEERITGVRFGQRVRSAILNISQAKYSRNRCVFDGQIDCAYSMIVEWEQKARAKVIEYHGYA